MFFVRRRTYLNKLDAIDTPAFFFYLVSPFFPFSFFLPPFFSLFLFFCLSLFFPSFLFPFSFFSLFFFSFFLFSLLHLSDPELRPTVSELSRHQWVAGVSYGKEQSRRRPSSQVTAVPERALTQAVRDIQRSVSGIKEGRDVRQMEGVGGWGGFRCR